jgi:hypothetical protein
MKKSRFTEEQIAYALRQAEAECRCRTCAHRWDRRSDVLRVAQEVREPGRDRTASAAPVAGRERTA